MTESCYFLPHHVCSEKIAEKECVMITEEEVESARFREGAKNTGTVAHIPGRWLSEMMECLSRVLEAEERKRGKSNKDGFLIKTWINKCIGLMPEDDSFVCYFFIQKFCLQFY